MSWPASSSRAWACGSAPPAGRAVRPSQNCGHSVASTSTGARAGSRSSSRSPAATRSPSPPSRVEVELGLVQPHHGPRPDARQLAQRGIGAGRVDRMPQPPLPGPVPQQLQRLPAGPGLARRGPADQHRDPAAALRRRPHHPGQLRIVARAARTPAAPAARAAGPRAASAGAPPERTGQSPHPAAAPPLPAPLSRRRCAACAATPASAAFHQLPLRAFATTAWSGRVLHPAANASWRAPNSRSINADGGMPSRQRRCPAGTPAGPGPPQRRYRTPAPYRTPRPVRHAQSHGRAQYPCYTSIRAPARHTPGQRRIRHRRTEHLADTTRLPGRRPSDGLSSPPAVSWTAALAAAAAHAPAHRRAPAVVSFLRQPPSEPGHRHPARSSTTNTTPAVPADCAALPPFMGVRCAVARVVGPGQIRVWRLAAMGPQECRARVRSGASPAARGHRPGHSPAARSARQYRSQIT